MQNFLSKKNTAIGIFDSGIGGLTIAKEINNVLPNENLIYFGDTEHLPYGEKSISSIQKFSERIIKFLLNQNCKIIIIACNSASASLNYKSFKKLILSGKIINVIDPVVNEITKSYKNCTVGVIGTKATIESGVYKRKIKKKSDSINVSSLATPLLAPMIEEGFINQEISQTIIRNYLINKKIKNIDHLVLACTHYPLIQNEIEKFYNRKTNIINSSKIVANTVKEKLIKLGLNNSNNNPKHEFFISNYTKSFEKSANFFFNEKIKLQEINLFI